MGIALLDKGHCTSLKGIALWDIGHCSLVKVITLSEIGHSILVLLWVLIIIVPKNLFHVLFHQPQINVNNVYCYTMLQPITPPLLLLLLHLQTAVVAKYILQQPNSITTIWWMTH